MTNDRTILITGGTGNQGGAVARALQGTGLHLRGLTRKRDSQRAAALARQGLEIVKGDLNDETTLRRGLAGAWGSSACRTRERRASKGKRHRASVFQRSHAKPASNTLSTHPWGSADKRTGVPHFDKKWRIEETVPSLRFPSHVILRPVFFMKNLLAPFSLQGSRLASGSGQTRCYR